MEDSFSFRVTTREQSSGTEKFSLFYIPGDTNVDITLERLEVEEGSKRTISKRYLFVHSIGIKHFLFNVTKSPHHGQIDVLAANKVDVERTRRGLCTSTTTQSPDGTRFISSSARSATTSRDQCHKNIFLPQLMMMLAL